MENLKIKEFDEEIEKVEAEIEKVENILEPLREKLYKLEDAKTDYIFKNKLYGNFPLDKKYIGKEISEIDFIDSEGEITSYYNDEILEVDDDGYPRYSSYAYGVLEYNSEKHKFVFMRYGCSYEKDFIGYTKIKFCDEEF